MRRMLSTARRISDRLALPVLAGGLVLVAAQDARARAADRRLAEQVRSRDGQLVSRRSSAPEVTVLVAAWNEAALIESHVRSAIGLRYPRLQYVLCAGGTDGTFERASQFARPGVVVIEQRAGEGKQAALRRALCRATGEVIFLTDADCLLDDESFERTLAPILDGEAEASTGGSQPLPGQQERSLLAFYHWAGDRYVAYRAGETDAGLLGRNCALTRSALERTGNFQADVPTGTDYHLAKSLVEVGITIRHVGSSAVPSRYAESIRPYARQQRRWLRNVVILGRRFGARDEVRQAALTSAIGLGTLLAPLAALVLGRSVLAAWLVVILRGAASKVRYVDFAVRADGRPDLAPSPARRLAAVPLTLVELAVWSLPVLDYLLPARRSSW
ncbi:MAG: glycosyltransferase family 2 protein [Chloroflexota bacterium]